MKNHIVISLPFGGGTIVQLFWRESSNQPWQNITYEQERWVGHNPASVGNLHNIIIAYMRNDLQVNYEDYTLDHIIPFQKAGDDYYFYFHKK